MGAIFGDNKAEKIRKNKKKLRDAITPPSYEVLGKMHDQVIETFNKEMKDNEQPKNAIAFFPKKKVNATSLKIAQQIAGVPIIQR